MQTYKIQQSERVFNTVHCSQREFAIIGLWTRTHTRSILFPIHILSMMCAMCAKQFDLMTVFVCEFVLSLFFVLTKTIPSFFTPYFHFISFAARRLLLLHCTVIMAIHHELNAQWHIHTQHTNRLPLKKEDTHFSMGQAQVETNWSISLTTEKRAWNVIILSISCHSPSPPHRHSSIEGEKQNVKELYSTLFG